MLVLLDKRKDETFIDVERTSGGGVEAVDQESKLQNVVEGDESEDNSSDLVENVEETKHDPVGQPLFVVISSFTFEGYEGHEGGVGHSHDVGDDGGTYAENHEEDSESEGVLEHLSLSLSSFFRNELDDLHYY